MLNILDHAGDFFGRNKGRKNIQGNGLKDIFKKNQTARKVKEAKGPR